jgi:hypothetical protein
LGQDVIASLAGVQKENRRTQSAVTFAGCTNTQVHLSAIAATRSMQDQRVAVRHGSGPALVIPFKLEALLVAAGIACQRSSAVSDMLFILR